MKSESTATNGRLEIKQGADTGAILFNTRIVANADLDWFDAAKWGSAATLVGTGGRGAAWFVNASIGNAVLRHYRRGGWAAKISDSRYLWRDESSVRSFHEFHFMQMLVEKNLPVPKPIAAMYLKRGVFYRAAILVERIPDVRSFLDWCADVLQRLQRSLLKYRGEVDEATIIAGMQLLRAAHDAEMEQ